MRFMLSSLLTVLLLAACGEPKPEEMAGLYKSSNGATEAYAGKYFAISPNRVLYGLEKGSTQYSREKIASVDSLQHTFDGTTFTSGQFAGSKIAPSDSSLPEQLQLLARSIVAGATLRESLKAAGLEVDFRLWEAYPQFDKAMAETLEAMAKDSKAVIDGMKVKGLTTLFIYDTFAVGELFFSDKSKRLYVTRNMRSTGSAALASLKTGKLAQLLHGITGSGVFTEPN